MDFNQFKFEIKENAVEVEVEKELEGLSESTATPNKNSSVSNANGRCKSLSINNGFVFARENQQNKQGEDLIDFTHGTGANPSKINILDLHDEYYYENEKVSKNEIENLSKNENESNSNSNANSHMNPIFAFNGNINEPNPKPDSNISDLNVNSNDTPFTITNNNSTSNPFKPAQQINHFDISPKVTPTPNPSIAHDPAQNDLNNLFETISMSQPKKEPSKIDILKEAYQSKFSENEAMNIDSIYNVFGSVTTMNNMNSMNSMSNMSNMSNLNQMNQMNTMNTMNQQPPFRMFHSHSNSTGGFNINHMGNNFDLTGLGDKIEKKMSMDSIEDANNFKGNGNDNCNVVYPTFKDVPKLAKQNSLGSTTGTSGTTAGTKSHKYVLDMFSSLNK